MARKKYKELNAEPLVKIQFEVTKEERTLIQRLIACGGVKSTKQLREYTIALFARAIAKVYAGDDIVSRSPQGETHVFIMPPFEVARWRGEEDRALARRESQVAPSFTPTPATG